MMCFAGFAEADFASHKNDPPTAVEELAVAIRSHVGARWGTVRVTSARDGPLDQLPLTIHRQNRSQHSACRSGKLD